MDPESDMVSPSNHDMTLDITFFVPCYNEEKLIVATLETILMAVESFNVTFEIIVVDDGSTDNSRKVIDHFITANRGSAGGDIILVENKSNCGVGPNYFKAAGLAKGAYFMGVCGDHSEPLPSLMAILNLLGKADIVIAYFNTRLFSKKFCRDNRRFSRRLISILFNRLFVRLACGHRLHYYNGPVLHKTANVLAYRVPAWGLAYQCEIVCKMLNDRKTFLEVMVKNRARMEGKTTAFRWKKILHAIHIPCRTDNGISVL